MMEDREPEDRDPQFATLYPLSSILYPPSSILHPPSSIFHPLSSILDDHGLLKRIPSEKRTWFCLLLSFGSASPRNV